MRKYITSIKLKAAAVALILGVSATSCMDSEDINSPKYLPQELPLGTYFLPMQRIVVPAQENDYQMCQNLIGDVYGRYLTITNNGWENSFATFNAPQNWLNYPFDKIMSTFYGPFMEVKERTKEEGPNYAWAKLLRVATMQKLTDLYGPMPYSQVGTGGIKAPYDNQKAVYENMFKDLDDALAILTAYVSAFPDDRPMEDFDLVYGGDYTKWIKFGNSLKLRMAMRISYAEPTIAKAKAEEAISHPLGVMTSNADNAFLTYEPNPIKIMWDDYGDSRVAADIVSYMKGYKDPRMASYFSPAKGALITKGFHGLRAGISITNKAEAQEYSAPIMERSDKLMWMNAAEVAFLRAEGALKGWSMGGTDAAFYKDGVTLSFDQHKAGSTDVYLADAASVPATYDDPTNANSAMSSITIKWDAGSDTEKKLERIMTQKWIAMWPLGQEAWSENRRTGYPRFFPVKVNKSGDGSLTTKLAARIPYAPDEQISNTEYYNEALGMLGGKDNYSTRLWWDCKTGKPGF